MIWYLHCLGIHYLVVGTDFASFRLKIKSYEDLDCFFQASLLDSYLDT